VIRNECIGLEVPEKKTTSFGTLNQLSFLVYSLLKALNELLRICNLE